MIGGMINVSPLEVIVKDKLWNMSSSIVERVIFVYGRVFADLLIPVSVDIII